MTKKQYNEKIKVAGLTKKELASIFGVAEQTVNNWGSTNKIPYWMESWLDNYMEKQKHDDLIKALKESGVLNAK